jgi:archaeal chaperonin
VKNMNGNNPYGSGQPIYVLPEGTLRDQGKSAQKRNIAAAAQVAEAVRTTLGPKGMDKMLIDNLGDIVITNDGVTILEEMEIQHPAAKMIVEVAKTQDEEIGDGTTTAAVIAGELLIKAEGLLDQHIHPTVITKGYRLAKDEALKTLYSISSKVDTNDKDVLLKLACTCMTGKSSEVARDHLAKLSVDAVIQVAEKTDYGYEVDLDEIKIEKKMGNSIDSSSLIKGIIIDKERVHSRMPSKIEKAKILLINIPIEVKETENDAQIRITSPDQLQSFLDQEEKMLKKIVDKIIDTGANVVFCQKGIDDMAQHYLSKAGILAVRRCKKSDMDSLSKATDAEILTSLEDFDKKDLGFAGIVEEKKIAGDPMIFVRDCKDPKAVSILVRGGTEHVVDEIKRAVTDAVSGIASALKCGKVVMGGGSSEAAVSRALRSYADKVGGREQLAIFAFAEALEVIPRTLAENAGFDPIDILVELRKQHDSGDYKKGIDVYNNKIVDMEKLGVIEPVTIKTQAIQSATEAAEMILRIDDVIAASKLMDSGPSMMDMPPSAMDRGM